jgi:hypothetical protein
MKQAAAAFALDASRFWLLPMRMTPERSLSFCGFAVKELNAAA